MTDGHEFGRVPAGNDRILPNWRVILSAWLVVGFVVVIALGIHAAAARFSVSRPAPSSAPLVIPRHDPACGAEARVAVNGCSGIDDWGLTLPYSEY